MWWELGWFLDADGIECPGSSMSPPTRCTGRWPRASPRRPPCSIPPPRLLRIKGGQRPDRPVLSGDVRLSGDRDQVHQQLRALSVPREGHSPSSPTCSMTSRCPSTGPAPTSETGSMSRTTARPSTCFSTRTSADLQHRGQCPDDQPRPHPPHPRDHGQARDIDQLRRGPKGHDLRYAVISKIGLSALGASPLLRRASR